MRLAVLLVDDAAPYALSPPTPEDSAVLAAEHREAVAALQGLAPRQREVLVLVVEAPGGRTLRQPLDVDDPRLGTAQPESVFYDGASVVVTSAADPSVVQVLVERMGVLKPTGEVALGNDGAVRTWLTGSGSLLSVVGGGDDQAVLWQRVTVSRAEVAALPWGTVCLDDVEDSATMRGC